jgi:hypothetical protein
VGQDAGQQMPVPSLADAAISGGLLWPSATARFDSMALHQCPRITPPPH